MVANDGRLTQKASLMRQQARDALRHASDVSEYPETSSQWTTWIEANEEKFREALRTASSERRQLKSRVVGDHRMPAPDRLGPVERDADSQHELIRERMICRDGVWFLIKESGVAGSAVVHLVCASTIRGVAWGLELPRVGPKEWMLPLYTRFSHEIRKIVDISDAWDLSGDATIMSAELSVVSRDKATICYRVESCAELERRAPRRDRAATGSSKKARKKAPIDEDDEEHSDVDYSDGARSVSSIDSSVDLDAESDVEAASEPEEDPPGIDRTSAGDDGDGEEADDALSGAWSRVAHGSNTIHHNNYATVRRNPKYKDIKVRIRPSLCFPHLLGTKFKSKTLYPTHMHESQEKAPVTLLLARAWVVHRMRSQTAFMDAHRARQRFVSGEIAALRAALREREASRTVRPAALWNSSKSGVCQASLCAKTPGDLAPSLPRVASLH